MSWDNLKKAIKDVIKENGNQEITALLLQSTLANIISSLGENYSYAGVAKPTTNPGLVDGKVFYIATEPGKYANFNGEEVLEEEGAVIFYNEDVFWFKVPTGLATLNNLKTISEKFNYSLAGKFADNSTPADWYWYPNGQKTAIPVDASTGEFATYYDGEITVEKPFNPNYEINSDSKLTPIERLDKMPPIKVNSIIRFADLFASKTFPTIDAKNTTYLGYLFVNNSVVSEFPRVHFTNTENVSEVEMLFNLNPAHKLISVTGLDFSNCGACKSYAFGICGAPYIEIRNLGKAKTITNDVFDLRNANWGQNSLANGARQSLVDSLLTYSFNRASAGYQPIALLITENQYRLLTSSEIREITNKGYDIIL